MRDLARKLKNTLRAVVNSLEYREVETVTFQGKEYSPEELRIASIYCELIQKRDFSYERPKGDIRKLLQSNGLKYRKSIF